MKVRSEFTFVDFPGLFNRISEGHSRHTGLSTSAASLITQLYQKINMTTEKDSIRALIWHAELRNKLIEAEGSSLTRFFRPLINSKLSKNSSSLDMPTAGLNQALKLDLAEVSCFVNTILLSEDEKHNVYSLRDDDAKRFIDVRLIETVSVIQWYIDAKFSL